jgi:hypothetical protein
LSAFQRFSFPLNRLTFSTIQHLNFASAFSFPLFLAGHWSLVTSLRSLDTTPFSFAAPISQLSAASPLNDTTPLLFPVSADLTEDFEKMIANR